MPQSRGFVRPGMWHIAVALCCSVALYAVTRLLLQNRLKKIFNKKVNNKDVSTRTLIVMGSGTQPFIDMD